MEDISGGMLSIPCALPRFSFLLAVLISSLDILPQMMFRYVPASSVTEGCLVLVYCYVLVDTYWCIIKELSHFCSIKVITRIKHINWCYHTLIYILGFVCFY